MQKVSKSRSKLATKKTHARAKVANDKSAGKYINPRTDFGFKYIYRIKRFLINFLNAMLVIDGGIADLTYIDTEQEGRSEDDRTNRFDLRCTTGKGEHIIIEMQNHSQEHFIDRAFYYTACAIQNQNIKGKDADEKEWDYKLSPVYSVNILNFCLSQGKEGKYLTCVQLFDIHTRKIFTDKMTVVFLELPRFTKTSRYLKTDIEQWTYVLKNLDNLDNMPDTLDNEIFRDLFHSAEVAKLSKKKRAEYDQSLKDYRNMNLAIRERDIKIAERDGRIVTMSRDIADRDQKIADRDQRIKELELQLQSVEQRKL